MIEGNGTRKMEEATFGFNLVIPFLIKEKAAKTFENKSMNNIYQVITKNKYNLSHLILGCLY